MSGPGCNHWVQHHWPSLPMHVRSEPLHLFCSYISACCSPSLPVDAFSQSRSPPKHHLWILCLERCPDAFSCICIMLHLRTSEVSPTWTFLSLASSAHVWPLIPASTTAMEECVRAGVQIAPTVGCEHHYSAHMQELEGQSQNQPQFTHFYFLVSVWLPLTATRDLQLIMRA